MMKAYADLASLPEDERIAIIGQTASTSIVGFFVDDDAKADRYIEKLKKYPVRLIERRSDVLVRGTVFVRVGPKES
jgi:hypothetical protein